MNEIEIYQIGLDLDRRMKILYFYKNSPYKILEFPKEKISDELNFLCLDFIGYCLLYEYNSIKKVSELILEEIMSKKS